MSQFSTNGHGDMVINNELTIRIGEIIDFLEEDPRFEQMMIRVQARGARKTGNTLGKWAQKQVPVAAQVQIPGTQRIS
jgi:hypothetical protein